MTTTTAPNLGKSFTSRTSRPATDEDIAMLTSGDWISERGHPWSWQFKRWDGDMCIGTWEGKEFPVPRHLLTVCTVVDDVPTKFHKKSQPDSQFKVGDRVRITQVRNQNLSHWIGYEAEVTSIDDKTIGVLTGEGKQKKYLTLKHGWYTKINGDSPDQNKELLTKDKAHSGVYVIDGERLAVIIVKLSSSIMIEYVDSETTASYSDEELSKLAIASPEIIAKYRASYGELMAKLDTLRSPWDIQPQEWESQGVKCSYDGRCVVWGDTKIEATDRIKKLYINPLTLVNFLEDNWQTLQQIISVLTEPIDKKTIASTASLSQNAAAIALGVGVDIGLIQKQGKLYSLVNGQESIVNGQQPLTRANAKPGTYIIDERGSLGLVNDNLGFGFVVDWLDGHSKTYNWERDDKAIEGMSLASEAIVSRYLEQAEESGRWNPAHFGEVPHQIEESGQVTIFYDTSSEPPCPEDFTTIEEYEAAWQEWEQNQPLSQSEGFWRARSGLHPTIKPSNPKDDRFIRCDTLPVEDQIKLCNDRIAGQRWRIDDLMKNSKAGKSRDNAVASAESAIASEQNRIDELLEQLIIYRQFLDLGLDKEEARIMALRIIADQTPPPPTSH